MNSSDDPPVLGGLSLVGGTQLANANASQSGHRTNAQNGDKQELQALFHLPIADAAKALGICMTMLKKNCRRLGISRWPYRQFSALNQRIARLEAEAIVTTNPETQKLIQERLKLSHLEKEKIILDAYVARPESIKASRKKMIASKSANLDDASSEMEDLSSDSDTLYHPPQAKSLPRVNAQTSGFGSSIPTPPSHLSQLTHIPISVPTPYIDPSISKQLPSSHTNHSLQQPKPHPLELQTGVQPHPLEGIQSNGSKMVVIPMYPGFMPVCSVFYLPVELPVHSQAMIKPFESILACIKTTFDALYKEDGYKTPYFEYIFTQPNEGVVPTISTDIVTRIALERNQVNLNRVTATCQQYGARFELEDDPDDTSSSMDDSINSLFECRVQVRTRQKYMIRLSSGEFSRAQCVILKNIYVSENLRNQGLLKSFLQTLFLTETQVEYVILEAVFSKDLIKRLLSSPYWKCQQAANATTSQDDVNAYVGLSFARARPSLGESMF